MRRAWIEISTLQYINEDLLVALHAESVDRNFQLFFVYYTVYTVALHAESVDRNCILFSGAN